MSSRFRGTPAARVTFAGGWVVVTLLVALIPTFGILRSGDQRVLLLILAFSLLVSGLNLSFGFAGELSFAQAAGLAAGAYVTGYLVLNVWNDVLLAIVASAIVGVLLGFVSGAPGVRLGGWMLAVSSFFLVLLVPNAVDILKEWTGGYEGLSGIPLPEIFGQKLGNGGFFVVVAVVTSAWFALFRNLVISRTGGAYAVLRQSPVLASSLGVSVSGLKLQAYALAGIPAGLAGTFHAYNVGYLAPESFDLQTTISILAASILAGSRSVYGVFLGAAIMELGPLRSSAFGDYAMVAYGVFLILAGVLLKGGIAGLARRIVAWIRSRRAKTPTVDLRTAYAAEVDLPPLHGKSLEVSGVTKRFGGIAALSDVSFRADPGEIVALIGPNGSGKTTLLNVINGYYKPDAGRVLLDGEATGGKPPYRIARLGVARTFQTPLVPDLTVRDVVMTARLSTQRVSAFATMFRLPSYWRALRRDREVADAILPAIGLDAVAGASAQSLPLGTRRLLELARSIAASPSVVLLDEVASGLDEDEIDALARLIRAIATAGATVVLVEHNFSLVRSLSDRVVVLSQGKKVVDDTPEAVATHPEVLEHYLGEPVHEGGEAR